MISNRTPFHKTADKSFEIRLLIGSLKELGTGEYVGWSF